MIKANEKSTIFEAVLSEDRRHGNYSCDAFARQMFDRALSLAIRIIEETAEGPDVDAAVARIELVESSPWQRATMIAVVDEPGSSE